MSNTVIQIKYSSVTGTPLSLNVAELAYSNVSNKLWINDETGIVAIGGKHYTDQIDASTSEVVANTIVIRDLTGNASFNHITANIVTAQIEGTANAATQLETPRTIALEGDANGSIIFDGTTDANITVDLTATGVSAGNYGSTTKIPTFEVDTDGRLLSAANVDVATTFSFSADGGSPGTMDLLSDTLEIIGGEGITTVSDDTNNSITIDVDNTVIRTNANFQQINGDILLTGNVVANYVEVITELFAGIATSQATLLPDVIAQFTSNSETYTQVNHQNINPNGSADYVVTADVGDDSVYYIDMGIKGSMYSYSGAPVYSPLDSYLIAKGSDIGQPGGNLVIGTITESYDTEIKFIINGEYPENIVVSVDKNGMYTNGQFTSETTNTIGVYANSAFNFANVASQRAITSGDYANTALDQANTGTQFATSAGNYANSAYAQANTATSDASQADQRAVTSGSYANSAFDQANTATTNAATADQRAVTSGDYANSAYVQANTATSDAATADQRAVTSGDYANSSYSFANVASQRAITSGDYANSAYTHANSAYDQANTGTQFATSAGDYANSAFDSANTADQRAVTSGLYANSAYDQANTATSDAAQADQRAVTSGSYANSAYTQANTATSDAAQADQRAVTSGDYANSAYDQANTGTQFATSAGDYANSSYDQANTGTQYAVTSGSYANSAFGIANNAITNASIADQRAVTSGSYANSAFVSANTAQLHADSGYDQANTGTQFATSAGDYANSAYDQANTGTQYATSAGDYANSAYVQANTATANATTSQIHADSGYNQANTGTQYAVTSGDYANSAYDQANTGTQFATSAGDYANSAYTQANTATTNAATADQRAVTSGDYANSAYAQANTATSDAAQADQRAVTSGDYANSSYDQANTGTQYAITSGDYANSSYSFANVASQRAITSGDYANSAYTHANSSYDQANTGTQYAITSGDYANSAYAEANSKLDLSGGTVSGDVNITGNLIVSGETVYANTTVVNLGDNIITLNSDIPQTLAPSENAGIEIDRGIENNVSIIWNETADKWTFTNDGTIYSSIASSAAESYSNSAYIHANSAYAQANTATSDAAQADQRAVTSGSYANSAFDSANTADQRAVTSGSYANSAYAQANTATIDANTADQRAVTSGDYANSAYTQANTATSDAATAQTHANAGYGQANTATTNAATADQRAVTSGSYANSAYSQANTATTNAATANQYALSAGSYANSAFGFANTADQRAVTSGSYANSAYIQANTAQLHATAGYTQANTATTNAATAQTHANAGYDQANTGTQYATSAGSYANSAYTQANTAQLHASAGYTQANTATTNAATADQKAVSAGVYANSAFGIANTATTNAATAQIHANAGYNQANTALNNAATADQKAVTSGSYANSAYAQANTATTNAATADQRAVTSGSYANSAFATANTKVSKSGDTMTGTLTFNNSTGTKLALNDSSAYWLATATNWGLYFDTTDNTLEFHGAGTSRAEIDLDNGNATFAGNVGIGTTAPAYKLDVNGDINIPASSAYRLGTGAIINYSGGNVNLNDLGGNLNIKATGSLALYTASTVRATLDASGNVGIGTISPFTTLSVAGTNTIVNSYGNAFLHTTSAVAADIGGQLSFGGYYTGTTTTAWAAISGRKENATDGNFSGYLSFATRLNGGADTERMRITSAGNVGIGTSAPSAKLHVFADNQASVDPLDGIYVYRGASYYPGVGLESELTGINVNVISYGATIYGVKATTGNGYQTSYAGYFKAAGNASNPTYGVYASATQPDVNGSGIAYGVYGHATTGPGAGTAGTAYAGYFNNTGILGNVVGLYVNCATGATTSIPFIVASAGTERMRITSAGNVGIGTSSPAQKLDVNGNIRASSVEATLADSITLPATIANINMGTVWGAHTLNFKAASTTFFSVSTTGGAVCYTGGFVSGLSAVSSFGSNNNYDVSFIRNNAEQMRLTSTGLGLGTTTPGAIFEVKGGNGNNFRLNNDGSSFTEMIFQNNGVSKANLQLTGNDFNIVASQAGAIRLYTSNTQRVAIDASGNVGIGTSAPTSKLHVNGNSFVSGVASFSGTFTKIDGLNGTGDPILVLGSVSSGSGGTASLVFTQNQGSTGGKIVSGREGDYTNGSVRTSNLQFYTSTTAVDTEKMRITSAGNVGIGTTAPAARLDISGDSLHLTETSVNLDTFKVYVGSGNEGYSHTYLKGQSLTLATYVNPGAVNYTVNSNVYSAQSSGVISNGALVLGAGTAERMRITSAGNVGIGTTTPIGRLHVVNSAGGQTPSNYLTIEGSTANNSHYPGIEFRGGTFSDAAYPKIYLGNAGLALTLESGYGSGSNTSRNSISLNASTGIAFNTSATGAVTERMRINSAGNVGIGTSSPTSKLTIAAPGAGNVAFNIPAENGNTGFRIDRPSANNSRLAWYGSGGTIVGSIVDSSVMVAEGPWVFSPLAVSQVPLSLNGASGQSANIFNVTGSGGLAGNLFNISAVGNVGIGTANPLYKLEVNGSFAATTKSFVIPHPTKPNKKLRYGSLEGPENGVYLRGKLTAPNDTIELPEYWTKLVDPDSITVQLTSIGAPQNLYVEDIIDNKVIVGGLETKCFYIVHAERVDVDKLEVEID